MRFVIFYNYGASDQLSNFSLCLTILRSCIATQKYTYGNTCMKRALNIVLTHVSSYV